MKDKIGDKVDQLSKEQGRQAAAAAKKPHVARSLAIAKNGLHTGFDTINMLTAVITDVLEEDITTNQANVVVNSIGKVLKVVELQMKYGKPRQGADGREQRDLVLIAPPIHEAAPVEH